VNKIARMIGRRDPGQRSHLVFAWSPGGYRLLERPGDPPAAGSQLDEGGFRLTVVRVGASPLPDDNRSCAFTLQAPGPSR
jgi:hypothetical protein